MASRKPVPADEQADGIAFRDNGTIDLYLSDGTLRLRTCRMGDYRVLVEQWREALIELQEIGQATAAWTEDVNARIVAEERSMTDAERAEDLKRAREIGDRTDELVLEWWTAAIGRLGDGRVTADDMPAWMVDAKTVNDTIQHWRSVPSRSGVQ